MLDLRSIMFERYLRYLGKQIRRESLLDSLNDETTGLRMKEK